MNSSPSPPPSKPLSDSPLFWLLLFGGMALAMAAVIQPKFAQREARLERMYHSRQLASERSASKASGAESEAVPPASATPAYQTGEPIVTLRSLMFLLAAVLLAASIALLFVRRGQASGHET
ncbi:MAG TPA: hypothetical protein VMV10_28260 [Pirellulales bacterium]|nr:hypothetical protein [Pirellulales bacterium]